MAEETEEFAELLRELKARSGQSYAGLAKRLHMSTSTVHRYCNGDAVPAEYAPVERFARVCGAKPEELVELHRHWILADAARRRKAATSRAVAAPAAAPAAAEGAAEADASPVPGVPAQGAAATSVSSAAAGPSSGAAHPSRPAGRLPTTRLALLGAAVVAIAATSAVMVGHAASPDRGSADHDDARRPQQAQPYAAPSRASTPKPLTASPPSALPLLPSPALSGGTATPAPGIPSEAPTPSAGPKKPDGGGGGDSAAGIPLTVATRPYVWQDHCDQYYLTDRQPPFMPPPPEEQDAPGWAANLRAVAGGRTDVELSVQGKGREAVVLHALRVRVVERSAPLSWSAYAMGSGCGGGLTPAFHDVDLDAGQPQARAKGGMQGDIAIPATDFPYKVSSTDPQVLKVTAHTEGHDVSWYLELEWSSGDRHGTVRVDDHGRPFRTSAIKDRPQYFYWLGKNVWSPVEGENRSK
ncbi:helix-turn-helix domain-containing protein [Streptomyces abikoensis]|uniref:helix-turn-helix domain-containing protein n=1 Tax=Streptomyces abikoensis TaxID=97398 RepID=UPI001676E491|nr:helix-turn-helix transcriptional regulator [Streptomyces abikoensis]GGP75138.1 transcriptional regulator [Streptomyces abikoensis]